MYIFNPNDIKCLAIINKYNYVIPHVYQVEATYNMSGVIKKRNAIFMVKGSDS